MTTRARGTQPEETGHGVRIARIGGVPVYLAPSWFLIAAVIVAIVATPYFPDRVGTGLTLGVVQALLLLVSVLVHEAAHAVTARVFHMPVIRIVANLWGGHTSFEAARSTPGRLAAIAAAGPASNAVLAVVAWLALLGTPSGRLSALLTGLVIINGSLAVLNFLPGMPLDGGQVVESLVWKATGNRNRGSVVAGWCGRVLTALLVLWFFVRPLTEGRRIGFETIWVLVIGSVLWSGASEAIRRGRALSEIESLRISQVMEPAVQLDPQVPVRLALDHPHAVVTTDARGIPCLVFAAQGGAVPPGLDPTAPLFSAVVRIPDESVVEVSPDANALAVVEAIQGTGCPDVVLTWQGRVYGIAHAQLVNQAAARN